jgi:general secretion pathway protein H
MPISACRNSSLATGRSARHTPKGFTLIEILVVLLIISVLAGITVTRFPSLIQTVDLDEESRRLELLFGMARNQALLDSIEYGFQLTRDGYEFVRYDDAEQNWQTAEPPLHQRTLPEGIRLTLKAAKQKFLGDGENLPPVLILSSGESTPFDLVVESRPDGALRTLTIDGYGDYSWSEDE